MSYENEFRTKARRHGYRGYGSPLRVQQGGVIHWGRGFSGLGLLGDGGGVFRIPRPAISRVASDGSNPRSR